MNVTCRSIFATMAVTVRMRRVASPYTVHPVRAKTRVYQTCPSSVFKRKSVGSPSEHGQLRDAGPAEENHAVGAATKCS